MNALKRFFEEYVSKACAKKPEDREAADRASRWFWSHLTDREKKLLTIARGRFLSGVGKIDPFTATCKEIRVRLFKR